MNKIIVIAVILIIVYMASKKVSASVESGTAKPVTGGISTPATANLSRPSLVTPEDSLLYIFQKYGADIAKKVERIYRVETAHFTSGQYKKTFSPGMERHGEGFPFGWSSMKDFWEKEGIIPGFHTMTENKTGKIKTFLKLPDLASAMEGLAIYLQKYPPGRWYSTKPESQAKYENTLATVRPRIVEGLINSKV